MLRRPHEQRYFDSAGVRAHYAALADLQKWLVWVPRPRGNKFDKVPCDPVDGEIRAPNSARERGILTMEQAIKAATRLGPDFGIGIHPPEGFAFGDLDDSTGAAWAVDLLDDTAAYVEESPSRGGMRFVVADPPGDLKMTGYEANGAGLYGPATSKFVTVTGFRLQGAICKDDALLLRTVDRIAEGDTAKRAYYMAHGDTFPPGLEGEAAALAAIHSGESLHPATVAYLARAACHTPRDAATEALRVAYEASAVRETPRWTERYADLERVIGWVSRWGGLDESLVEAARAILRDDAMPQDDVIDDFDPMDAGTEPCELDGLTLTEDEVLLVQRRFGVRASEAGTPGAEYIRTLRAIEVADARKFRLIRADALEIRPPEYLIDGLLETDSLAEVFGESTAGKSFVVIDMGLSIASGSDFHGRQVRQGAVVMLAGEGGSGLPRRLAAWSKARGISLAGLPFHVSERAAALLDPETMEDVYEAIDATGEAPALLVIDTLNRNFGPGDENSTQDMTRFIAAADALRLRYPGSTVALVHHTGLAEKNRARGSSVLRAALDAEYKVEGDGQVIEVTATKMKDGPTPPVLFFALTDVDLGEQGASAVLKATDPPQVPQALTRLQQLAVDCFDRVARASGQWDGDEFLGVAVGDWREDFYDHHGADNQTAKKKAFGRVRDDLEAAEVIARADKSATGEGAMFIFSDHTRLRLLQIWRAKQGDI